MCEFVGFGQTGSVAQIKKKKLNSRMCLCQLIENIADTHTAANSKHRQTHTHLDRTGSIGGMHCNAMQQRNGDEAMGLRACEGE